MNGSAAAATIGEWKAEATGRRTDVQPADFAADCAHAMSVSRPASTTWPGALSFAMTSDPADSGCVWSNWRTSSAEAVMASIVPSCPRPAAAISTPRVRAVSANRSVGRTPAAANAVSSPKL